MLQLKCWMHFLFSVIFMLYLVLCGLSKFGLPVVSSCYVGYMFVLSHHELIRYLKSKRGENIVGHYSLQLLRFSCLKFVRRGCHIWPRIRWRGTFIAPATSFSLFLSLLWAIQDPKQQTKQCCTFSLQVFALLKKSMRWTNRLLQPERLRLDIFSNCLYWLFYWYLLCPVAKSQDVNYGLLFQINVWSFTFCSV